MTNGPTKDYEDPRLMSLLNIHSRLLDFILDPRMPYNGFRNRNYGRLPPLEPIKSQDRTQLLVALTFDVENEPWSPSNGKDDSVDSFLEQILATDPRTTIFVEGALVEETSRQLRSLQEKGVEIGLHGYQHELWGRAQWYLRKSSLNVESKRSLLDKSLEAFNASGLRRPVSFRAPYLVADESTIKLLSAKGYLVDSSLPSHRGVMPVPQYQDQLVRIPVTVDPTPRLSHRFCLPYYRFLVCNLKTIREVSKENFFQYLSHTVKLQKSLGFPPHLVILSHSWECAKPSSRVREEHSLYSESNLRFLQSIIDNLSEDYDVKRVTMMGLAQIFRNSAVSQFVKAEDS